MHFLMKLMISLFVYSPIDKINVKNEILEKKNSLNNQS